MSEPLLISRGPLLNFSGGGFWAPHPHRLELAYYKQVEYRFQAMKSLFIIGNAASTAGRLHDEIVRAVGPGQAKDAGRLLPIDVDRWDAFAPRAMLEALALKFTQNPSTLAILRETGDSRLVEHRPDPTWGDGLDGSGRNLMGLALMHVREKLCR